MTMHKLFAEYLADFNAPRYDWWDREEPRGWSTLVVVLAVLALVGACCLR
jgi:hypothetical protein